MEKQNIQNINTMGFRYGLNTMAVFFVALIIPGSFVLFVLMKLFMVSIKMNIILTIAIVQLISIWYSAHRLNKKYIVLDTAGISLWGTVFFSLPVLIFVLLSIGLGGGFAGIDPISLLLVVVFCVLFYIESLVFLKKEI